MKCQSISSGAQYARSCTLKLDDEIPMFAGLAQEIGFGSAEKECNKYDLTTTHYF